MIGNLKIGDILTRVKDTIDILDEELYTRITIKTKHAGVYKRDKLKGALIGTKKQFKVKKGQFILSKIDARLGAFGIVPETLSDAIITGNFWVYEVDANKVNINWFNLYTSSTSFYEVCNQASSETTHRKYLDEKKFLNFSISLPTKKEQDSTYKWYINRLEKFSILKSEIKSQELYVSKLRQAILQDAIQGKLTSQDPTDEPASVLLERIKKEKQLLINAGQLNKEKPLAPIDVADIPYELPEGWKWCRIADLFQNLKYGTSQRCEYTETAHPILRIPNIVSGQISTEDLKYTTLLESEFQSLKLKYGDIVIIRSNGSEALVGRSAVFKLTDEKYGYAGYLIRLRANLELVNTEYVHLTLESDFVRRNIELPLRTTSGVKNINSNEIMRLMIPLPPYQEQERIVSKISQLLHLYDEIEQQIIQSKSEAEQLLQAVLKEAFEGKHIIPKQASKQDEVFWQKQLLASYINILMEQHQEQGEMAIAKYAYLNDKLHKAGSGFRYVQHNFGPYSPEIKDCLTAPDALFYKKTVGKKGYEVYHVNKELEAGFIDSKNRALQEAQKGFQQLMQVFSIFSMQERARRLELIASVCWLIEKLQTVEIEALYKGLQSWETPKRAVDNKGELFAIEEVIEGLQLITNNGWDRILLFPTNNYLNPL